MPLFMIVSGYLASMSIYKSKCSFDKCIRGKFIYLLIPFLFWYFLIQISTKQTDLIQIFNTLIANIDNGLWYLYVLFACYVIFYVISQFKYKYVILLLIFILLPNTTYLGIKLIKYYLLFFTIGFIIYKYKERLALLIAEKTTQLLPFFGIVFLISLMFWERTFTSDSLFVNNTYFNMYKITVALIGSLSIFFILKYFYSLNIVNKLFCLYGVHSMKIYIFNFIVIGAIFNVYPTSNQLYLWFSAFIIAYFIILSNHFLLKVPYFGILVGQKYEVFK